MSSHIIDQYGRTFKTLRLSLTNTCNLACVYCTNGNDSGKNISAITPSRILNPDELVTAVEKIHELLALKTVRLTGGEPTLYKELLSLVKKIKSLGIENIKMTSNGYLLQNIFSKLLDAGLNKINISLDALDPQIFHKISKRKNCDKILEAIETGLKHGAEIKINTVVMKGYNEDQIIPLLNYAKEKGTVIRFLELMKMGPLHTAENFNDYFVPQKDILKIISEAYNFKAIPREPSSTANYWEMSDGYRFGIIANETQPFCQDCDRLRLDSFGNIYGCLSSDKAISIYDCIHEPDKLSEKLRLALSYKEAIKFKGSNISMLAIGG